jgi:predicted RNA-binding protein with PUA-like domain
MAYWLLKTEPETYSFAQLLEDKKTNWNGVRNFQARNNLRKMATGDVALIYHSGDDKAVVGVARVVREAYKDVDPEGGDWVQLDIEPLNALPRSIPLSEIKKTKSLAEMPLLKQSRLSVMPISESDFRTIIDLAGQRPEPGQSRR